MKPCFKSGFFSSHTPNFLKKSCIDPLTTLRNLLNSSRMDNPSQKTGRGRPKGSTSTIEITLADLLAKLNNDPNAIVQVGRTWYAKYKSVPATSSQDGDALPPEIQEQLQDTKEEDSKVEFVIS